MAEPEAKSNTVRIVIITLASVGCVGLVTIAAMAFFVIYTCAWVPNF